MIFLSGCMPMVNFKHALYEIDKSRNGKTIKINSKSNDIYYDDNIKIVFYISEDRVNFTMVNRTNNIMEIVWDKSSWIDIDRLTSKIVSSDTIYIDKTRSHINSIVPSGTSINKFIIPEKNITIDCIKELFPYTCKEDIFYYIGKDFGVFLYIKIGEVEMNYLFVFKIYSYSNKQYSFTDLGTY